MLTVIWQQILATTALEWLAVVLALAYLILAIREHITCWVAGFLSNAIYLYLFWQSRLISEALLQIFYMGLAVFGFWRWWHGQDAEHKHKPIVSWPLQKHLVLILATAVVSMLWGHWVATHVDAAYPYLDALTTGFAITTTWLVAEKVLENWIYWFVIDATSIWLYVQRDLWLTALLFTLYVVMCIIGWRSWRRAQEKQG